MLANRSDTGIDVGWPQAFGLCHPARGDILSLSLSFIGIEAVV